MTAALRRGLDYNAVASMTTGQIIDYCLEYDEQYTRASKKEEKGGGTVRNATQADIDAFLG